MEAAERNARESGEAVAANGGEERLVSIDRIQAKYSFLAGVMWQRDYMRPGIDSLQRHIDEMQGRKVKR